MCYQTRNSCTNAFDNRSSSKNLKPNNRGGGGQFDHPPALEASRVKSVTLLFCALRRSSDQTTKNFAELELQALYLLKGRGGGVAKLF